VMRFHIPDRTRTLPTAAAWRRAALSLALLAPLPACSRRQPDPMPTPMRDDTRSAQATRAELEAMAVAADRAGRQTEAVLLRERIRSGDFTVGDRVFLEIRGGEKPFADTVTVRGGRVISIPDLGLPDIPLQGVLRSELQGHLQREVAKYIREPEVNATSYLRLTMTGAVGRQGFYAFPADILLTDAIMQSGGPRADWDLDNVEIRRSNQVVVDNGAARVAITDGRTLDQLNLRAGDQIVIGQQRPTNWFRVLRTVSVAGGLVFLVVRLVELAR